MDPALGRVDIVGGLGRPMLSGFNTNFRYRGVLFHVQTEDSGLANPHVITHLFHGGNIMASEKRDYSHLLAQKSGSALEEAVRKLMEGLHKTMLRQLSRGEHDAAIEQRMGPDVFRVEAERTPMEPATVTEEQPPPQATPRSVERAVRAAAAARPRPASRGLAAAAPAPRAASDRAMAEPTRTDPEPAEIELTERVSSLSRVFGERLVSEKPLDEVVLDYLVENARKRRRPGPK